MFLSELPRHDVDVHEALHMGNLRWAGWRWCQNISNIMGDNKIGVSEICYHVMIIEI